MTDSRTGLCALRHTETPRGKITLGMTQQTTVLLGETSQQARNVHVTWTSCAEDRERERELRVVSGGKVIPNEPLFIEGAYLMFLFFFIQHL